ncbi:MAG: LOG family protein [Actinomycetia bacterium]|nr:LOG family protein [Actinomycetes bacterium]
MATRDGQLTQELLLSTLRQIDDPTGTGARKLMTRSFRELREAFSLFAEYPDSMKVSIFGSARTPADHPDYAAAVDFSRQMADLGWLVITGAGDGIMKAGHEGPGAAGSFGLSIQLPFETSANSVIAGNEKLLKFRYFFTRKLIFLSSCQAVVAFPGGFGTQDELLEVLTLIQTGRGALVPIVLVAGPDSSYWPHWERYVREELLTRGFIAQSDLELYYVAQDPADAAAHIEQFYANYHSSRYVRDDLVIRIKHALSNDQMAALNEEFGGVVRSGRIVQRAAFAVEEDVLHLPRIVFTHTRRDYAIVRRLIDRINSFPITARNHAGRTWRAPQF